MDISGEINYLAVTKRVAGFVVASGVSKIVKDIIVNNTAAPEKPYDKVVIYAGAAVIGMMAKDAAKGYVSKHIDDTVAAINKVKNKTEELVEKTANTGLDDVPVFDDDSDAEEN